MSKNEEIQLQSEKYWLPIRNRDIRTVRKHLRRRAVVKLFIFGFFAAGAAIGYMYCNGHLEDLELHAKLDMVRNYLKI